MYKLQTNTNIQDQENEELLESKSIVEKRGKLLYPDLSFVINGVLISVHKEIGGGHLERYYQKAVAIALTKAGLKFVEQYYVPLKFDNQIVGKYYLDFLIEDRIVLELKRAAFVPARLVEQTKQYLSALNLKLAIVACFTYQGVIIKRILNEY